MQTTEQAEVLRAGELEIRPSEHLARARGRTLSLSVRELELLAALARREGRIVPREELYETVWGAPLRAEDRSVDVYVHKLRTKLAARCPSGGSSTPTSGSATGSSRSLHTFFTAREQVGNRWARACLRGSAATTTRRKGLMRTTRFMPALAAAAALAFGVAACGSDNQQRRPRASGGSASCGSAARRHAQRRGRDVPAARLPGVGGALPEGVRHHGQLPGHRLRRRRRAVHGRHRRLRRVRLGDDRRGDRGGPEEGRARAHPDGARRGDRLLQPRRREVGPQARRPDDRGHLPRQDHEVERPGDRGPELRREAAGRRASRSATAPTSRARPRTSPRSWPTTRTSGRTARASTSRSSGRAARAPRATTASPPASSRTRTRSATSSRPTRWRTTSRSRA